MLQPFLDITMFLFILTFSLTLLSSNSHLTYNQFPYLPIKGLYTLRTLRTVHNKQLHWIPSPRDMPFIQQVITEYPYHCCDYKPTIWREPPLETLPSLIKETIYCSLGYKGYPSIWEHGEQWFIMHPWSFFPLISSSLYFFLETLHIISSHAFLLNHYD